jgi:hypothetical protein
MSEIICGSFDEHKSYFISHAYNKKNVIQVKIIKNTDNLEQEINKILLEFNGKYEIIDIKYAETSCMLIYKKL